MTDLYSETWKLHNTPLYFLEGFKKIHKGGCYNQNNGVAIYVRNIRYESNRRFNENYKEKRETYHIFVSEINIDLPSDSNSSVNYFNILFKFWFVAPIRKPTRTVNNNITNYFSICLQDIFETKHEGNKDEQNVINSMNYKKFKGDIQAFTWKNILF